MIDKKATEQFLIIRLDGRDFHILAQQIGVTRPFDLRFALSFVKASEAILQKNPNALLAYAISDEVNFVILTESVHDWSDESAPILAERFSNSFCKIIGRTPKEGSCCFDWKVFQTNRSGVLSYLRERQEWAYLNFLKAYAFWSKIDSGETSAQARKSLEGLNPSDLMGLLDQAGIDVELMPLWQRRGIVARPRSESFLVGEGQPISLNLDVDLEVPRLETRTGRAYLLDQLRCENTSIALF